MAQRGIERNGERADRLEGEVLGRVRSEIDMEPLTVDIGDTRNLALVMVAARLRCVEDSLGRIEGAIDELANRLVDTRPGGSR